MFGKINAKQIESVMKKMGVSQTPVDAKRVIIEMEDSNLVIDEPSVTKVIMQGQETFQITGNVEKESKEKFNDEDVKMVMEKTGKGEEKVRKILDENSGDLAGAIMELK
jgi:nascent polypeptide-associated complex subunit alpha